MIEPLRDAHIHLAEHGRERSWLSLESTPGREACLESIAREAGRLADGDQWVVASGLRHEAWSDPMLPDASELEAAAPGRLVLIHTFDHHAMIVSPRVLQLAGIDGTTPDPPGGIIDRRDGRPTGLLLEDACNLVRAILPEPTVADRCGWILTAQRELLALGIREVHDMHSGPDFTRALLELESRGLLELEVDLYAPPGEFDAVRAVLQEAGTSARVRLAGLKLFVDGTLNSRTAHMLHPFAHPIAEHPRGTPLLSDEEVVRTFQRAGHHGVAVATHAIGDGAVRRMLDLHQARAPEVRLRIEHAEFIDEADIDRFARQGVVASMQPCHLLTDIEAIRRLTPHRAPRAFPLRDLTEACARAGVEPSRLIVLGSDAPIVRPDPADNVQAAVHRRRAGMTAADAVALEQMIEEDLVIQFSRCTNLTEMWC